MVLRGLGANWGGLGALLGHLGLPCPLPRPRSDVPPQVLAPPKINVTQLKSWQRVCVLSQKGGWARQTVGSKMTQGRHQRAGGGGDSLLVSPPPPVGLVGFDTLVLTQFQHFEF